MKSRRQECVSECVCVPCVFSVLHNLSPANHLSGNIVFDLLFRDTLGAFDLLWLMWSTRK